MLESVLAFDPHYGICRVFYSESLGGWRQILNDGSHESVTEGEMKNFRLFPYRSAYWINARSLVDLLLKQWDLSGVEDVYSEMMTAVQTLRSAVFVTQELNPLKIGLKITRQKKAIHLCIGRCDNNDFISIDVVHMDFADALSLKYNLETLVKALIVMNIVYDFKQFSGEDILNVENL
jgi:hypothetical protein